MRLKPFLRIVVGLLGVITLMSACGEEPSESPSGPSETSPETSPDTEAPEMDPGDGGIYAPAFERD